MTTDLILGTAGHIDHGKTSLIKALTGADTDRLPEEKKRGITIELGFAQLKLGDYRLGIVDVPGHERFVRNMLAGATGVDLALLVVAADDSVKPQTEEHLEILRLLDLEAGVIALTKCDLAEPDWIGLVEDEVRELVSGTFLADAPVVHTSVTTGEGLEELRQSLVTTARQVTTDACPARLDGPFRMAIDRTFTIAGHGTVVTGSVSHGSAHQDDELVIEPGGIAVRVRGIQNHEDQVDYVHRGHRAAINLAGVHHDQIVRGQELGSPGHLRPSRVMTIKLRMSTTAPRPLKHRARVRLHLGTAEVLASVALLDQPQVDPGGEAFAQLFLRQPAVASWRQPFVLRSESPVRTVGGGHVLNPVAEKIRRITDTTRRRLAGLESAQEIERASAAAFFAGTDDWTPDQLASTAGVLDADRIYAELLQRGDVVETMITPTRKCRLHADVLGQMFNRIEAMLDRMHVDDTLAVSFERSSLIRRLDYVGSEQKAGVLLQLMAEAGRLRLSDRKVALPDRGPQLSANEEKIMHAVVHKFQEAGFQPPSVKECQQAVTKHRAAVPQLIRLAVAEGDLVEINQEMYLHRDDEARLRSLIGAALAGNEGLTVSEIREVLNTSRKYAVPLVEYLDRVGFTQRLGDKRKLVGN